MVNVQHVDPIDIKKILIVQFRPFGDVLLATSYLKALKNHFLHARIDFLVKRPYQEILDGNPYLSQVIAIDQAKGISYLLKRVNLFIDIRRRHYDLIIDQQSGTGSGQLVMFSGAPYRLGWKHGKWSRGYNLRAVRKTKRYRALQNFDMVSPLGIPEEPVKFFFLIKPTSDAYIKNWLAQNHIAQKEFVLISPGSPRRKKKWELKRYAALADLILSNTKMKVVLLRAPDEYEDCRVVVDQSGKKPVIAPPTTFNQAAALVRNSKLLICNDGGVNHLSVALGVPSLAIFGNTTWEIWSPEGFFPQHYHMVNPNWKRMSDNSFGISPEETFQRVLEILESLGSSQGVENID
jgi:ADP-heptose:LPS heptosyltransferase